MENKEKQNKKSQLGKKLVVYPMLFTLFVGSMWLIFSPSGDDEKSAGYNTEVPQPTGGKIEDDKQKAYEKARYEQRQQERQKQVETLASMFDAYESQTASLDEPAREQRNTIQSSAAAYQDINKTLGNFYETPKEDAEKAEMQKRLDELSQQLEQQKTKTPEIDPMAMMERSYQLAAKYMPGGQPAQTAVATKEVPTERNGKAIMTPIEQVRPNPVSSLNQPMTDSAFMADYSKKRNMGFNTAVGMAEQMDKNTIRACVHENQTLTNGQTVRLRLLEPMKAGRTVLPANSLISGAVKLQGERLYISITSLETEGTLIPVELSVYDSDGQQGVFIPNSMETNAAKEIAANMGSSLGTSVSITNQGAGDQLLSELGKGVIQGASQYVSKMMREVKVHLKAGYQLYLYQSKN